MLLTIPDLSDRRPGGASARELLDRADWVDGRVTAGPQSARAKQNQQLPEGSAAAEALGDMILTALQRNSLFVSAALPLRVFPPLFNRYQEGTLVRQSHRQRHPADWQHGSSHPHRSVRDAVSRRSPRSTTAASW